MTYDHAASQRAYYLRNKEKYRRTPQQSRVSREKRWKALILFAARKRAAAYGIEFTITKDDFDIPDTCPILGIPLAMGRGKPGPDSASLDKINPALGYVPGNVQVISLRANMLKRDATPQELLHLADWIYKQFSDMGVH